MRNATNFVEETLLVEGVPDMVGVVDEVKEIVGETDTLGLAV